MPAMEAWTLRTVLPRLHRAQTPFVSRSNVVAGPFDWYIGWASSKVAGFSAVEVLTLCVILLLCMDGVDTQWAFLAAQSQCAT